MLLPREEFAIAILILTAVANCRSCWVQVTDLNHEKGRSLTILIDAFPFPAFRLSAFVLDLVPRMRQANRPRLKQQRDAGRRGLAAMSARSPAMQQ
ncbi:hypothetical protein EFB08_03425 [Rufibacter latericius]|uniref:Uncharacterized protein n=1 Tax=Rufibacter latericius TaxID=2487040 RepID=A0A3M9N1D1_9BACT|nr:hypothetical protein EFB08_03425 [Rufibacter latericius]